MSMYWLLLLSSIWNGALLLRVAPKRKRVHQKLASKELVWSAGTSANNTWKRCATSGIDCASPYEGKVCFVPKTYDFAAKVADVDPMLIKFRSALEFGEDATAQVKLLQLQLKMVRAKTSLVALEQLRKRDGKEAQAALQAEEAIATSVEQNIQLLSTLLADATESKVTLASPKFLQVGESQAAAVEALRRAKAKITKDLAAGLETWTDRQLLVRNDEAFEAYNHVPPVHHSLRAKEKSLSAVLLKFCVALEAALDTARQEPIHSQRERAKQLVSSVLLLLEGGFFRFRQDGFIVDLKAQNRSLETAMVEATREVERQASITRGIFDKHLTGGGPFRIFEVNPYIIENFLGQELPQAFLGLSSCLTCNKDYIPDLDLSYVAGGSGTQAFVCVQVRSVCLQEKVVCGCYVSKGDGDYWSLPSLATRDQAPVHFSDGNHTRMGCNHMILREENRASTDAGVSTLAPASSCRQTADAQHTALSGAPLRVCMATWNVGSERQRGWGPVQAGVGWGGVDNDDGELARDLNVILGACPANDHDVVAVTLQEGSAPEVVEIFEQIVKTSYGREWVVAAHSFAKGSEKVAHDKDYKGYKGNYWLHEIPSLSEFSEGVHMVVLSRKSSKPDARSFAVKFSGSEKWAFASRPLGSTGFKGAAIVQLDFQHGDQARTICFAGAHLDASDEEHRKSQSGRVTEALQTIGCRDGVWWAGDFNPRLLPHQCCPWDRLELLMHHGQKKGVVDIIRDMDPIISGSSWRESNKDMKLEAAAPFSMKDWQCHGHQCSAGWHELPIGFAPTFHKIYDRAARNSTEGTCRVFETHRVPNDVRHVLKVALNDKDGPVLPLELGKKLVAWNNENRALIKSWNAGKQKEDKCPSSDRHMICWDGEYNMKGCKEKGYCYHTSKKHHCPLFTDRILFSSSLTQDRPEHLALGPKAKFPIVQGCRYEAIPNITTADHSPVVAAFTVTFGPREEASPPQRERSNSYTKVAEQVFDDDFFVEAAANRHEEVKAKIKAFQLPRVISKFF